MTQILQEIATKQVVASYTTTKISRFLRKNMQQLVLINRAVSLKGNHLSLLHSELGQKKFTLFIMIQGSS